jgi:hypothetical protein
MRNRKQKARWKGVMQMSLNEVSNTKESHKTLVAVGILSFIGFALLVAVLAGFWLYSIS